MLRPHRLPHVEYLLFQIRRQIALIELQTDCDRQPTLRCRIRIAIVADTIGKLEVGDLSPISISREAKTSGCRQAGLGQHRKIRSLRADASRVGRCGIVSEMT